MDHKEAMSRLRLARTTYVGPITCQLLMARYGTAVKALAAIPEYRLVGGGNLRRFLLIKRVKNGTSYMPAAGSLCFVVQPNILPH
ncbi:MAG: hypothetical protein HN871_09050 [Alphaproteobacteria bacterium]|nr:hypothetical protein [Alphaproteobacteria bacterium]